MTASLHSALRKFRSKSESLVFWADGVCINQDNIIEKNRQIRLMTQIFGSASSVLADIGEETDNSSMAFDAILRASNIASEYFTVDDYPHSFTYEFRRPIVQISEDVQTSLETIFQRPWFRRV